MTKFVESYTSNLNKRLELQCGYCTTELESRFEFVRTQETNVGNWIADILLTDFVQNDIVLLNGGTLRCNAVIPPGPLTFKTMANMIPMDDKIV